MKQLLLLAAVIAFGVAAIKFYTSRTPSAAAGGKPYRTITPEEAKALLDTGAPVILLDVRSQAEYDEGHVPGAVCLPNESIIRDMPVVFDRDAEILVYCRSGRRSAEAAGKLAELGYTQVSDFGGIQSWPYEITTD